MFEIRIIVCPIDFSENASVATDLAMEMAEKFDATVHLLHVCPIDTYIDADGGLILSRETVERIRSDARKRTNAIAEPYRAKGRKVEVAIEDGRPADEVLRFAESVNADLLVVGTHGRTGLAHLVVGSIAERIVRTSPIPVMTVRMKGKPS